MKSTPLILPVVALLAAFTLPEAKSQIRTSIRSLFSPVAYPARIVSLALTRATKSHDEKPLFSPNPNELDRAVLLVQIQNLAAQLEDLKKLSQLYTQLGENIRKQSQIATVTSARTDQRQTLTISTIGLETVKPRSAVFHPLGFVGTINSVGVGNAQVLLIIDPTSRLKGRFVRYLTRADGGVDVIRLAINEQPLVEGTGDAMVARKIPAATVRNVLQVGDIVELDADEFPIPALKGVRMGVVTGIDLPPTDAGHAEIHIKPTVDLVSLKEVFVVK